ncbi:hypothetical protein [uncultured Sphingopyxis sp.]|jgi:hypothetical protein|uniref:hypothetical protein n=1 Tax=uncultured Sphingopyxis sp. TaxID=310581 RepID=UPI0025928A8B|nr:hypothetical protein [uncultured Sphingopyxis sp.]
MESKQFREAAPGSTQHQEVAALNEMLRSATAQYVATHPDPRVAMSLLMTALQSHSGILFGQLLYMGEVPQQDTARAAKMAARNFREGIKVGLARSQRIGREVGFEGTQQ